MNTELLDKLPTRYRQAVDEAIQEVRDEPAHRHRWVLVGSASMCLTCGEFGGVACVVLSPMSPIARTVYDVAAVAIKEALADVPEVSADVMGGYLAQRIADRLNSP